MDAANDGSDLLDEVVALQVGGVVVRRELGRDRIGPLRRDEQNRPLHGSETTQQHRRRADAGERSADRMRNSMGSWTLVFASVAFLAGWTLGNGTGGIDPYPFIFLNLLRMAG